MPLNLAKEQSRLWSLNSGVAMVVTDLHGDWEIYKRYRDHFMDLNSQGIVDCIIFTGDLIHSESNNYPDQSLEIVLDILELRSKFGNSVIYLCGNHELPHIYGYALAKGKIEYTPFFEQQMSRSNVRRDIINLFISLPFYIRTAAGVSITHAGAAPIISSLKLAKQLFNWNHENILSKVRLLLSKSNKEEIRSAYAKLSQAKSYEELAIQYLSVTGMDDPRFDDLLIGFFATSVDGFDLLYSALTTKCELEFGLETYDDMLVTLLQYLSSEYINQFFLVSGHITVQNGYEIVTKNQLRIASGVHSKPLNMGRYLLFDTAQPIETMDKLLEKIHSIY